MAYLGALCPSGSVQYRSGGRTVISGAIIAAHGGCLWQRGLGDEWGGAQVAGTFGKVTKLENLMLTDQSAISRAMSSMTHQQRKSMQERVSGDPLTRRVFLLIPFCL